MAHGSRLKAYHRPVNLNGVRLVLASGSPRRAELLTAAGYSFDRLPVDLDERVHAGEAPSAYVRRLAAEKSEAGLQRIVCAANDVIVIGADTTVVVGDEMLGKPRDAEESGAMLRRLSGRGHQVLTGVSIRHRDVEVGAVETTTVWFDELTAEAIDWYVSTGEGLDKAGAYAIQGVASRFVPRIDGSYSNVVGLPVQAVTALIAKLLAPGSGMDERISPAATALSHKP
jgi:septum formation protein